MASSVEIIDFTRPVANSKNLYISGIVTNQLNEAQILNALYEACSQFGLVYEVQVFPGIKSSRARPKQSDDSMSYYAFAKFYSYYAAQKAKVTLSKNLKIGSQICKLSFAVRSKDSEAGQILYASKCQELANFYLGFNGWTSAILRMEEDTDVCSQQAPTAPRVRFFCVVELSFPRHSLSTQGVGAWEELFCTQDLASKSTAILKARKRSYQRAVEQAFSTVLLVVLGNGKVSVELDTTRPDHPNHLRLTAMADQQLLQVNELEETRPEDETSRLSQGDTMDMSGDVDDVNLHILQDLGETIR